MSEEAPLFDLSAIDFRPSWAKEPSSAPVAPREPRESRESRESREPRPDKRRGFERGGKPGGPRPGPRPHGRKPGPPRRDERPAPPPPNPFPWLRIAFTATPAAVDTVVQQVRHTGKTFSLFEIARILLRNPGSYTIDLTSAPKQPEGPFWVVDADHSAWLDRESAVRHLLRKKRDEFYRAETVEIEPPKGNFPVVAVCGMSGVLLGPPNHHDFERRLRELHRERFSRMDFETFRSRIKMARDPETVEKWRSEASKATEYYPREGENPEKLPDLAAVERHFAGNHAPAHIGFSDIAPVPGDPKTTAVDPALAPLLNHARGEEERFPLRLAQSLSRSLSAAGLRFYKGANRTTWVAAARPRHLDLTGTPVSDSIRRILETIREKKSIRRPDLLDVLAPLPAQEFSPAAAPSAVPSELPSPAEPPASPAPAAKTPEESARQAIVEDLLWLTHEGYVIEYADGRLESVPPPKHPKPAPSPEPSEALPEQSPPIPLPEDQAPEA